jgi:aspartate carbamoyltransferase catalytic subunit
MQEERGSGSFVPSLGEFTATYGMTERRAALVRPDAVITHPGPMVRGVEIASAVADDPRCLVRQQVGNGVPIRMAALYLALSTPEEVTGG